MGSGDAMVVEGAVGAGSGCAVYPAGGPPPRLHTHARVSPSDRPASGTSSAAVLEAWSTATRLPPAASRLSGAVGAAPCCSAAVLTASSCSVSAAACAQDRLSCRGRAEAESRAACGCGCLQHAPADTMDCVAAWQRMDGLGAAQSRPETGET